MNLHISQTLLARRITGKMFDYPLNLHISQTDSIKRNLDFEFDYPLNLHISQTSTFSSRCGAWFDYPLNLHISQTLLSFAFQTAGLIILWIYISLKPTSINTRDENGLIILWIYISLKLKLLEEFAKLCLIILWIYISLKLDRLLGGEIKVWLSFEFTYLSNTQKSFPKGLMFDYPLNLHISQTSLGRNRPVRPFDYPLNLHISQTMSFRIR